VIAWWLLLATSSGVGAHFLPRSGPASALTAFAPADLVIIAVGSAVVALRRADRLTLGLAWFVSGAMCYASLYTIAAVIAGFLPALGAVLMVPAACFSVLASAQLSGPVK
jgi:hypothetical protein